jgi:hypothetical protein
MKAFQRSFRGKGNVCWGFIVSFLLIYPLMACQAAVTPSITSQPTATFTKTETPTPTTVPLTTIRRTPETPENIPTDIADVIINFAEPIDSSPSDFGVNGWWTDEDALTWQERYRELAPEVVRVPIFHAILEPQNDDSDPGHVNASGFAFNTPYPLTDNRHITYRKWFQALQQNGATILIYIPYVAPWLSKTDSSSVLEAPYPPKDITEYQEFIEVTLSYLMDDVGFPPERIILEPVNEPDLACGSDPAVACFWRDWQIEDLSVVFEAASASIMSIDPGIRMAGPALCCNVDILHQLMENHHAAGYLDVLTFHSYIKGGFDLSSTFAFADQLRKYNKPIFLDEYGSTTYWSNGEKGALWHSAALSEIWKANLSPIQFSMAEMPGMHEGYNELGLFKNWEAGWLQKPSYWVYANFFNNFHGAELVKMSSPEGMPGIAGRTGRMDDQRLAIWLTNGAFIKESAVLFRVENWETDTAHLEIINNLSGSSPISTRTLMASEDRSLVFSYNIPPLSSFLFLLSPP